MNEILILLYHRILTKEDDLSGIRAEDRVFLVKEEDFTRQLEYLHANGWQTISLGQLVTHLQDKIPLPQKYKEYSDRKPYTRKTKYSKCSRHCYLATM